MPNFGTGADHVTEVVRIVPSPNFVSGCKLEKIGVDKKDDGKRNLEFTFRQVEKNAIFKHIEFDPTEKMPGDTEEKHQEKINWQMSRIKHIMGRFMTEEQATIPSVGSWAEFIQQVGSRMKSAGYASFECTLKLIYNKKGYVAFPMFPAFISTPQFPRDFEVDPAYDIFRKPNAAKDATATPTASDSADAFDDDPFGDGTEDGGTDTPTTEASQGATPEAPATEAPEEDDVF